METNAAIDNHLNLFTKQYIENCSYTDFVALINQTNVPPGSHSTITKWAINSFVKPESNVLEVACTTGFSLRELSLMSGCSGLGFDISEASVGTANQNKNRYASNSNIDYVVADGFTFDPKQSFTHIIVGAALGFFPSPEKMLKRCLSFLGNSGYILASPFYVNTQIPEKLLQEAENIFGITPTTIDYKQVMSLYRGLDIYFESREIPIPETQDELKHYCESTVARTLDHHNICNIEIYDTLFNRLYDIKDMSNRLRAYQGYSVLVLKFDHAKYPGRYVELF